MSRLDEIQARLDAATPGPWGHWPEAGTIEIIGTDEPGSSEPRSPFVLIASEVRPAKGWGEEIYAGPEPDADLIAHAPTDLATLIEFARRVEAVLDDHDSTNEQVFDDLDRAMKRLIGGAS
jgi:hypothetical protein